MRIIQGEKLEDILATTTVEGVPTAEVAMHFGQLCGLQDELPIFTAVAGILAGTVGITATDPTSPNAPGPTPQRPTDPRPTAQYFNASGRYYETGGGTTVPHGEAPRVRVEPPRPIAMGVWARSFGPARGARGSGLVELWRSLRGRMPRKRPSPAGPVSGPQRAGEKQKKEKADLRRTPVDRALPFVSLFFFRSPVLLLRCPANIQIPRLAGVSRSAVWW